MFGKLFSGTVEGYRLRKIYLPILILVPIFIALFIRLDDFLAWSESKERFFFDGRPLLASFDAFSYARYAEEYKRGLYKPGETDPLRFFPDNFLDPKVVQYPSVLPMLSWLGAWVSKLQGTYVENVSIWLIPVFSVLFIVPLVLFFWELKLPLSGFSGALLGSISFIYLIRTCICRLDTDSSNLFFPFASAYFFLKAIKANSLTKKTLYSAFAGITLSLFYWWYGHHGLIFVAFLSYIFALFFVKGRNLEHSDYISVAVVFLTSNPLVLTHGVVDALNVFFRYTTESTGKTSSAGFPNIYASIAELKNFNIETASFLVAGNWFVLIIGAFGALFFFLRCWRTSVLLLPALLPGTLALTGGDRFAMFISPFIGMGLGFMLDLLVISKWKDSDIRALVALMFVPLIILLLCLSNKPSFEYLPRPPITTRIAMDFIKLRKLTPPDAKIWTWWDYGYAINYYAERGTFHDGANQVSPKTYFIATTFSAPSPEQAYNTILAISSIGLVGIQKLLDEGKTPKDLRDEIFQGKHTGTVKHPIYWAFTEDEIPKFFWINYFGTWDFDLKTGRKSHITNLTNCRGLKKNLLACGEGLIINLNEGIMYQGNMQVPIKEMVIRDDKRLIRKRYHNIGIYFEVIRKGGRDYIFLLEEQTYESMFNQMYMLRNYEPKYFELVYDDFPAMVLYKVKGTGKD